MNIGIAGHQAEVFPGQLFQDFDMQLSPLPVFRFGRKQHIQHLDGKLGLFAVKQRLGSLQNGIGAGQVKKFPVNLKNPYWTKIVNLKKEQKI